MIRNLNRETLQSIVEFVKDNYEAPQHLIPQSVEALVLKDGNSDVFIIEDEYGIEAVSFFKLISPKLAEKYRTVVRLDVRGKGLSKKIDEHIESLLKSQGVKKLKTHVYTDNFPSLFGKLKRGYYVEGLLRNHDAPGIHEYIMGKEL